MNREGREGGRRVARRDIYHAPFQILSWVFIIIVVSGTPNRDVLYHTNTIARPPSRRNSEKYLPYSTNRN